MNEQQPSNFDKARSLIKTSISLKLIIIGFLILIMNIPLERIDHLLEERKLFLEQANIEVKNTWGNSQLISGPEMIIPYYEYWLTTEGEINSEIAPSLKYLHLLPETLNINGHIRSEELNRSIYPIHVYSSDLKISGNFVQPDHEVFQKDHYEIQWDDIQLVLGVKDHRSIKKNIKLSFGGEEASLEPGDYQIGIISNGLIADVDWDSEKQSIDYHLDLSFKGSDHLSFLPLGKNTTVSLTSNWPDPKFIGEFLPNSDETKKITESGFEATWDVYYLNRTIPQVFEGPIDIGGRNTFGVELYEEVDEYKKTERSMKYAFLFISLVFLVFFFIQLIHKVAIHPFQYFIVGIALCIFYVLLISLSEILGFNVAYAIASAGILLQVTLYTKSIGNSWKIGGIMALLLAFLFGFIFFIVQLAVHSLLIGSIGMFVLIGVLMYLTRNIDWQKFMKKS